MRIYRTTLSCSLRAKGYATYHAREAFTTRRRWTRHSIMSPSPSCGYRLLHLVQPTPLRDGSAFTLAHVLRLRSCRSMGAFIMSPLPPIIGEEVMNSRAPWLHGRYSASSLLRAPPPPSRLRPISRWMPVIRPTLLRRFLDGTRTASPVAQRFLVTVLPLPPRRSESTHRSDFVNPCCLRFEAESSASGVDCFGATYGFTCVAAR
jgi:hypothetical protein